MTNKGYILMLENDEHDRETSSHHFNANKIPFTFLKFSNEVISFLNDKTDSLPTIILLSMNSLPENGLTVLQQIKTDQKFKHIPVIVLGENTEPDLIKLCYMNGANTFFNKPFSNQLTNDTIQSFIHYWFDGAELPKQNKIIVPEKV